MAKPYKFVARARRHDRQENMVMNIIRPFTDRKHMPDRWVSFNSVPTPMDYKTNIFVEDSSHDEYFRLLGEGFRPFIVYRNKRDNHIYAHYIDKLTWSEKQPASDKSTSNDDYYIISGGLRLDDFLEYYAEPH